MQLVFCVVFWVLFREFASRLWISPFVASLRAQSYTTLKITPKYFRSGFGQSVSIALDSKLQKGK